MNAIVNANGDPDVSFNGVYVDQNGNISNDVTIDGQGSVIINPNAQLNKIKMIFTAPVDNVGQHTFDDPTITLRKTIVSNQDYNPNNNNDIDVRNKNRSDNDSKFSFEWQTKGTSGTSYRMYKFHMIDGSGNPYTIDPKIINQ
jgi:hypothetical protein